MDFTLAKKNDGLFLGFFDGEAVFGSWICGARVACVVSCAATNVLRSLGGSLQSVKKEALFSFQT